MANIIERDIASFGVPVHNPPYQNRELWCRFDLAKLEIKVKHPHVIADLVPRPLEYIGETIYVSANKVQEFKGSFASYASDTEWNEIVIQIPSKYQKIYYYYCCEIFVNNFAVLSVDREMFGFPKTPAEVVIEKTGNEFNATACYYGKKKGICNLTFKPIRSGTVADLGIKPRIINFKHIPSPVKNKPAEVNALVALKYLKQAVHQMAVGEGTFELLEFAPEYLVAAGIEKIEKAIYMDLELHIDGARIVYDYNANM